jgi:hypothetical protein
MASSVPPTQQQMPTLMQQPPVTMSPAQPEELFYRYTNGREHADQTTREAPTDATAPMAGRTPSQAEKPPLMMQPMAVQNALREPQNSNGREHRIKTKMNAARNR